MWFGALHQLAHGGGISVRSVALEQRMLHRIGLFELLRCQFRRQIVELVRAGRDPTDLAREFEPSAQAIRNWVAQADRAEGRREKPAAAAGLTADEREELVRLRRENKQLRLERA